MNRRNKRVSLSDPRNGVAAVEMAMVLPVLLLVMFGTLNWSQLIFFRKSLVGATQEGMRLACQRTATEADVEARIRAILASRRINDCTVSITPSSFSNLKPGDRIDLAVTANFTGLGFGVLGSSSQIPVTVNTSVLHE